MVLVGLDEAEVASLLGVPAVGVVEQEAGGAARVDAEVGDEVEGAGEVEPLVVEVDARADAGDIILVDAQAEDPEELHDGVVEVQLDVVGLVLAGGELGGDGLFSGAALLLVLGDNGLEGAFSELGALVLVEVDVGDHDLGAE